ncbi:DUF4054 domain-containing protein (plasmid) [Deinococcus sp. KNUC1210]|uniref:DUF4054 domain-containing protein n=1 Tax=Deinococcus sp. KNUC1210 TaxID=2917691 RepID=UPI001EEFC2D9|nr:DUF4054 domain-containing protein [Deinococcus sp. KNUC1210]ULH17355.1 DUF4054 domain-containing protein [Deinococcus sp. KNUC1210]
MSVLLDVTPQVVATLYPQAPAVTDEDVQAASDWAAREMRALGWVLPLADTPEWRELRRAISAYALYLATSGGAASGRGKASTQSAVTKSITFGSIKIDRAAANVENIAESLVTSSLEWLEIAGRHLSGAGLALGWGFPGTAR